jgi:integrase
VHVVRREDDPNGAWAKSRRRRVVPLDFLTVQAFDSYQFERMAVLGAMGSDLVFVNLFRPPLGAPMRLDAVNDLVAAASRRAGISPVLRPHQLRHPFGSNVADAGGGIDVIASLLGHVSAASSQVYCCCSSRPAPPTTYGCSSHARASSCMSGGSSSWRTPAS